MAKPQDSPSDTPQDKHQSTLPAKQKKQDKMDPSTTSSYQWGQWDLSDDGRYYFRGRSIQHSEIQSIPGTSRNSIVHDGYGHYTLYEFVGVTETPFSPQTATQELTSQASEQAQPPTSAPTSQQEQPQEEEDAQDQDQSNQHLQVPEHEDDSNSGYTSAASGAGSNVQIIEFEHTKRGVNINFPKMTHDDTIILNKKTKKRIKADKKKKVHYAPKIDTWIEGTNGYGYY